MINDGYILNSWIALPKTNISPENRPFDEESSFSTTNFQVLYGAMLVSGSVIMTVS